MLVESDFLVLVGHRWICREEEGRGGEREEVEEEEEGEEEGRRRVGRGKKEGEVEEGERRENVQGRCEVGQKRGI